MLKCKIVFFCLCLVMVSLAIGVDVNYVNSNALRSQEQDVCYSKLWNFYCKLKCGMQIGVCIEKQCYCLFVVNASKTKESPPSTYKAKAGKPLGRVSPLRDPPYYGKLANKDAKSENSLSEDDMHALDESMIYSLRPTTRHHIAHFCSDLDIARECIRTCMKKGKPAFCGKDHVCYCGHKYQSIDDTSGENVENIYAQFRDLYEKYFGTRNTEE